MRIAIVNWSSRKAGGAETYLDRVIGGVRCAGHNVALFCETDLPADRAPITLPPEAPVWSVSKMGVERAISAMRRWCPDIIYGQGLVDPNIEARTLEVAVAVLFAHNYYATCISGAKTFKYPVVKPCARRFGWECLMHFYPHRCGGLSPFTMWQEFKRQSRRLKMLHSYKAIITASEHMRSEYLKHGFAPDAVKVVPYPVGRLNLRAGMATLNGKEEPGVYPEKRDPSDGALRLLFVGRMDLLKGGAVLLDALPEVLKSLGRPLHMTFVGGGPERGRWEEKASRLRSHQPRVEVNFTGWLTGEPLERAFSDSDLLIVPSLWPEPFGLVGPEAGVHSLPVAAFAVGGIPEWLTDGVNGYLASGDPPKPEQLAEVIVKCLCDSARYAELCRGAIIAAGEFNMANHLKQLMNIFHLVGRSRMRSVLQEQLDSHLH